MNAYHETQLPDVRSQLAEAVDYAVIDLRMSAGEFQALFVTSEWAKRIERGDKTVVLGMSGIELAERVLRDKTGRGEFPTARMSMGRSAHGLSQTQLAERSGVGLRSIQMYEQRNKDINRAEAGSLLKLARALGCEMEDLLEPQGKEC